MAHDTQEQWALHGFWLAYLVMIAIYYIDNDFFPAICHRIFGFYNLYTSKMLTRDYVQTSK